MVLVLVKEHVGVVPAHPRTTDAADAAAEYL
jgi:hypothetical protein